MTKTSEPLDPKSGDALLAELYDIARLFRREFYRRSRAHGTTRAQWHVLAALVPHAGIRQIQLADLLDIEPITLVRLLDRLEASGLVERRADPTDRRARTLHLTNAAAPVIKQIREIGSQCRRIGLHGFSDAEQADLLQLLQRIRANFAERNAAPDEPQTRGSPRARPAGTKKPLARSAPAKRSPAARASRG